MTLIPLFIFDAGSEAVFDYPQWVSTYMTIALFMLIAGVVLFLISVVIDIVLEGDTEKINKLTVLILVVSVILLISGVVIMALTGVRIE